MWQQQGRKASGRALPRPALTPPCAPAPYCTTDFQCGRCADGMSFTNGAVRAACVCWGGHDSTVPSRRLPGASLSCACPMRSRLTRPPSLALPSPQCVAMASGSKCKSTNAYVEYCSKCNTAGTSCTTCSPGRQLVNGVCSRPCKLLWGIGCRTCTDTGCSSTDPAYAQGRR